MKKSKLNAVVLHRVLAISIVLLIILTGAGFYFVQGWLHSYAIAVSHTVADSKASDTTLQTLSKLQKELETRQDIIRKTNAISTSTTAYQTQAVKDLITYAQLTGVTISDYTFPATVAATPTAVGTVPNTQVTIKLGSPVSYTSLLNFMAAIEGNLPKMQITSVNLARIEGDPTSVKIDQLIVAVYTR